MNFRCYQISQQVQCVRKGWRGVWDALKAAVTGQPRTTFAETVTLSVYASAPVELTIMQLEGGGMTASIEALKSSARVELK